MQVCGLTRILFPAMFAGIVASTLTGSDPIGWGAALVAGLVAFVYQRVRGTSTACAVPVREQATVATHDEPVDVEA